MENLNENRLQKAKEKLRSKLSYESIKKLPKYAKLNKKQHEALVSNIEAICVLLLTAYTTTKT